MIIDMAWSDRCEVKARGHCYTTPLWRVTCIGSLVPNLTSLVSFWRDKVYEITFLSVYVHPSYQHLNAWTNLYETGIYVMAPEPISVVYLRNPSNQSVCIPMAIQWTYKHIIPIATKYHWKHNFLCGLCHMKGNQAIRSSHNLFFFLEKMRKIWSEGGCKSLC